MAQTRAPQVLVVRIGIEYLAIIYPDGKSEILDAIGPSLLSEKKKLVDSGEIYQHAIANIYENGYELKSTFSSPATGVTLVFTKE